MHIWYKVILSKTVGTLAQIKAMIPAIVVIILVFLAMHSQKIKQFKSLMIFFFYLEKHECIL